MECIRMDSRHLPSVLLLTLSLLLAVSGRVAAQVENRPAPVLQLSGNDFPQLVQHLPALGENGLPLPLDCTQIRARRVDELDPLWKQAVGRIHLDCEDLTVDNAGFDMVATVITAFLKPGKVQFAGLPVTEIRLMDSELWTDHQYVLDRSYADIREHLKRFAQARCRARRDDPTQVVHGECTLREDELGLYLEGAAPGGVWIHADPEDPRKTLYAEAWAD